MRRPAAVAAAWVLAACASPGPAPSGTEVPLRNAGFEADPGTTGCAPGWHCSSHSDPGSFRYEVDSTASAEGRRSLRIERVRGEPWGVATQRVADPALRGARLRFSLSVRTEGATGNGGGPFLIVHGNAGVTVVHEQKLEQGTTAWKRVAIDFTMPAAAESFEVGAILEGPGRLWIDAARVDRLDAVPR